MISLAAHLKSRLHEQQLDSRSISPSHPSVTSFLHANATHSASSLRQHSEKLGMTVPRASLSMMNLTTPDSSEARGQSGSPELYTLSGNKPSPDPFLDLLFSGWNSDLPDPGTLNH
jgi:hypothetical protein